MFIEILRLMCQTLLEAPFPSYLRWLCPLIHWDILSQRHGNCSHHLVLFGHTQILKSNNRKSSNYTHSKELHTQLIRNQTSCAQALERKRRGSECCSLESNSIRLTWSLTRTRGKNHNKIKYRKGASMWPFGISQESLPITFLLCII